MMRKIALVLAVLLAATVFVACAADSPVDGEGSETLGFIYNEVQLMPGGDFAAAQAVLGEPDSYYEAASCAFDGKDKIYTYGSLQISVSPLDGKDVIFMITLLDDSLTTPEGVYVGAERAAVLTAYGEGGLDKGSSITYTSGKTSLVFLIREDCVTSVQYRYVDAVIES